MGVYFAFTSELFYTTDVYKTTTLKDSRDYFKIVKKYKNNTKTAEFYVEYSKIKTRDKFKPVDKSGNKVEWIECNFNSQGSCQISICDDHDFRDPYTTCTFTPNVIFHKGDKKQEVNQRLVKALADEIEIVSSNLESALADVNEKKNAFLDDIDNPFLSQEQLNITVSSINKQVEELELRIKDCKRLLNLVA